MADSFQNEVPKARINLKLDLHTGGASKKMELPLKLLVTGDFSNGQESATISEREKINITKNNTVSKRFTVPDFLLTSMSEIHLTMP